jgi:hypothetical protein
MHDLPRISKTSVLQNYAAPFGDYGPSGFNLWEDAHAAGYLLSRPLYSLQTLWGRGNEKQLVPRALFEVYAERKREKHQAVPDEKKVMLPPDGDWSRAVSEEIRAEDFRAPGGSHAAAVKEFDDRHGVMTCADILVAARAAAAPCKGSLVAATRKKPLKFGPITTMRTGSHPTPTTLDGLFLLDCTEPKSKPTTQEVSVARGVTSASADHPTESPHISRRNGCSPTLGSASATPTNIRDSGGIPGERVSSKGSADLSGRKRAATGALSRHQVDDASATPPPDAKRTKIQFASTAIPSPIDHSSFDRCRTETQLPFEGFDLEPQDLSRSGAASTAIPASPACGQRIDDFSENIAYLCTPSSHTYLASNPPTGSRSATRHCSDDIPMPTFDGDFAAEEQPSGTQLLTSSEEAASRVEVPSPVRSRNSAEVAVELSLKIAQLAQRHACGQATVMEAASSLATGRVINFTCIDELLTMGFPSRVSTQCVIAARKQEVLARTGQENALLRRPESLEAEELILFRIRSTAQCS